MCTVSTRLQPILYEMTDQHVLLLQHLPSLFVFGAIVSSFIFGTKLSTIPFVLFGTYSAWIYLRYLQLKPELSIRCASSWLVDNFILPLPCTSSNT